MNEQSTPGVGWLEQSDHVAWLREQTRLQLEFARGFPHPDGGAAYLDEHGHPDPTKPVYTWITARMAHAYSLGHLAGVPGCLPLATHAVQGLQGPLHDEEHGGWFVSLGPRSAREETKSCYAHAFVAFAASSAAVAGVHGARALLDESLDTLDRRFWEEEPGLHADAADRDFSSLADYRGVNANMHTVEALLAASDTTGNLRWRARAGRITSTVLGWASDNDWRIPEHFDAQWTPMLEHHRDQPDDAFQPYGATVGHGLEWARLALHVRAALGDAVPTGLLEGAQELFDRAVTDGWTVDGASGFVYTTDWSGRPVVRQRMHWVAAEAISAAAALWAATGQARYDRWYRTWWDYAARYLVSPDGSWQHELDPTNQPASTVWPGRPDIYHSLHSVLLGRLPLAPSAPTALAAGLLR